MRIRKDRLRAFVTGQDAVMSARELSRRIGKSPTAVYQMIRPGGQNTCKPETAERIAEVLRVPLGILFDTEIPSVTRGNAKQDAA